MRRLKDLLVQPEDPWALAEDPFFERYGLLKNPFPPARTIIPEILYDQDEAWDRFASLIQEVLGDTPERRTMGILGGTGGGKTHFLRHCRWQLEETSRRFAFVEFQAGSGKVQDLVREAFRAADALCQKTGEVDFITALVRTLALSPTDTVLRNVQQDDLRSALRHLMESTASDFKPMDRGGQYGFETLRDLFRRWLFGDTLNQTERKYLGVFSRISTASLAVRVLRELFTMARSLKIIVGMLLCLDEVETLFTGGLRPAQYQAFLQDLRYLYDEALRDGVGYSLLMISASTSRGADELRNVNYPVYQRLGFESEARVELSPVSGVVDARDFAYVYVEYAHSQWQKKHSNKQTQRDPKLLLSEKEIEAAYRSALASSEPELRKEGKVNQAPLLEALHRKVEDKRQHDEAIS